MCVGSVFEIGDDVTTCPRCGCCDVVRYGIGSELGNCSGSCDADGSHAWDSDKRLIDVA